ncbi:MAG: hypothetical protein MUC59_00845 [Saprospiraceae bacterium]|nr:hypothetical protein [Saprospiraceae bacterium]
MKIRISGNSLRLRLSQSEVKTFFEVGEVIDGISFGTSPNATLLYVLKRSQDAEVKATYIHNAITVNVPADIGDTWANSEQEIGIEVTAKTPGKNGDSLRILIEKDFKCLANRAGEDESDNFPNPTLSC